MAHLNEVYLQALRAYAASAGRNWKQELAHDWARAGSRQVNQHTYSLLHQLRNAYGPRWLDTFTFPEDV